MRALAKYLPWLESLNESFRNVSINKNINRLWHLLKALESKTDSDNVETQISSRLDRLKKEIEINPSAMSHYINSCHIDIKSIAKKQFGLVYKNEYQNEWLSIGVTIGVSIGLLIFVLTDDIIYLSIGISIGLMLGASYGSRLDGIAESEGRAIKVE